jgi:hypothetical protein
MARLERLTRSGELIPFKFAAACRMHNPYFSHKIFDSRPGVALLNRIVTK